MKLCLALAASISSLVGACRPIAGDRITGKDLADADPRFAGLPASLIVGYAAPPGSRRTFSPAELARIARGSRVDAVDLDGLCFEIPMRPFTAEEAAAGMRRSLPAEATLRVVEVSRADIPPGEIEFPISSLEPPSPVERGVRMWRGSVRYSTNRRTPVWARVEVSVSRQVVVAQRDLPANEAISAASVRLETSDGPLAAAQPASRLDDVIGKMPKRALRSGEAIPLDSLEEVPIVRRGESVGVEVICGRAVLKLEAIAERDARRGETLRLRNPVSGKTFVARMEGTKAVVVVGGSGRNL